jgi:diguanylate cyclase (GGDEF)-like protein/PAS domain S-box-containing protein
MTSQAENGKRRRLSIKWQAAIAATIFAVMLIILRGAVQLHFMREELTRVMSDTQFAMVTRVADEIDNKLALHLDLLTQYADAMPRDFTKSREMMRSTLRERTPLLGLYDDILLFGSDGQLIADLPSLPERAQVNTADRPFFQEVLRTARPVISQPVISKIRKEPIIQMAAPIFAPDGHIAAVLVGVIRLNKDNFLAGLGNAKNGKSGYFFLVSKRPNPVYVMHPNHARILQPRPEDSHGSAEKALDGFEGTIDSVNSAGMHGLFSFKGLKSTNWILGAALPAEEAFAPLTLMEQRTYLISVLAIVLIAPVVWLAAWFFLSPLSALRDAIQRLRSNNAEFVPVPVLRNDEIGDLAGDFNLLIAEREAADTRMRESESRLRMITDNMPVLIAYVDRHLRFRFTNKAYGDWFGFEQDQLLGSSVREFVGGRIFDSIKAHLESALTGERVTFEHVMHTKGTKRMVEVTLVPHGGSGEEVLGVYTLIHDITERKKVEDMLRRLVRVDTLTQLPNRHNFDERLAEAVARSERSHATLALMFLDIDRFKAINDTLGHQAGDEVLREFARRLSASVRSTDMVARLAGDEFVVILEGMRDANEADLVARKILQSLVPPIELASGGRQVTTSIGIAVRKLGQMDPAELLRHADRALYAAKREGRNRYHMDFGEAQPAECDNSRQPAIV